MVDSVLESAAPHLSVLQAEPSAEASEDALKHLLDLAIAYNNPHNTSEAIVAAAAAAQPDAASIQAANGLATYFHESHPHLDVSRIATLDSLRHTAGRNALREARVVEAAIQFAKHSISDDGEGVESLLRSLAALIKLDARIRDDACQAGATEVACAVLDQWETHDGVCSAANALLVALAFTTDVSGADSTGADKTAHAVAAQEQRDAQRAEDDDLQDLIASFHRQQLDTVAAEAAASGQPPPPPTPAAVAAPDDVSMLAVDSLPSASDLMDSARGASARGAGAGGASASGAGVAGVPGDCCIVQGAGCLIAPCFKALSGCSHGHQLCAVCDVAVLSMSEQRVEPQGQIGAAVAERERWIGRLWCPECRQEALADSDSGVKDASRVQHHEDLLGML